MPESYKEDGRPSDQWYWDDWFSSHDVHSCGLAAQGLWINLLGIMFTSQVRGTLAVNGIRMDNKAIAKRFGKNINIINKLVAELEEARVFSRLPDGTIYSRRMYRRSKKKEKISEIRSKAGKEGMKKRWEESNKKGNNKKITKITAPSSSSSSPPPPPPSIKTSRSEKHSELAVLLESKIKERLPKHKFVGKDYLEKWANVFRLMEEKKEAMFEEIKELIIWISKDDFWYKNVLSAETLRKQLGRLSAEMKDDKKKRGIQTKEEINAIQKKALEGK